MPLPLAYSHCRFIFETVVGESVPKAIFEPGRWDPALLGAALGSAAAAAAAEVRRKSFVANLGLLRRFRVGLAYREAVRRRVFAAAVEVNHCAIHVDVDPVAADVT